MSLSPLILRRNSATTTANQWLLQVDLTQWRVSRLVLVGISHLNGKKDDNLADRSQLPTGIDCDCMADMVVSLGRHQMRSKMRLNCIHLLFIRRLSSQQRQWTC